MKKENDDIELLFKNLEGQFDQCQPNAGHHNRFSDKLAKSKKKVNYWYPLSIAAGLLLLIGLFFFLNPKSSDGQQMEFASKQTRETDSVFNSMIRYELSKLREKQTPENAKIIADAAVQLDAMESDYDKIRLDLAEKGESEQIIYALIQNLQTRISFLQNVMLQIENNQKSKNLKNENSI